MHYPLSKENKVDMVGQAILAFRDENLGSILRHMLARMLIDIDMEKLLYAVCGIDTVIEHQ
jgi:hypothetical protein